VLRAFLLTMRAVIGLLHWKRAPGSKYVHWRQVCRSPRHFSQELSREMTAGAFAPHEEHFTVSPNAIIFGDRGPSLSTGFD
jgi:hypothetical protein